MALFRGQHLELAAGAEEFRAAASHTEKLASNNEQLARELEGTKHENARLHAKNIELKLRSCIHEKGRRILTLSEELPT